MFYIPHTIRFLRTLHKDDVTLAKDALLTSKTNLQWQKIFHDILIGAYHYRKNRKANPNISFQKDIIDFRDSDAVDQRLTSINYYLSSLLKDDFDYCHMSSCYNSSPFDDFYFVAKSGGDYFVLHKGGEEYRKIFYSKVVNRSFV